MGPNRQRKPRALQRSDRSCHGHGYQGSAKPKTPVEERHMLSKASKEMIIDVLQHAATGGKTEISERHFDPKTGSKITFHRNVRLTSSQILQRALEGLGFPPDLTEHHVAELEAAGNVPNVCSIAELLDEVNGHQKLIVQCCFNLFAGMVWFHLDDRAPSDSNINADDEQAGIEGDAILEEELEMINTMYHDHFLEKRHFDEDSDQEREIHLVFQTEDEVDVLVVIQVPDYYPRDPPLIFLQRRSLGGAASPGAREVLGVYPAAPREFAATSRRKVLDAAAEVITAMWSERNGCLIPLIGSIHSTLSSTPSVPPVTTDPVPSEEALRRLNVDRQGQEEQRAAFLTALVESAQASNASREANDSPAVTTACGKRGSGASAGRHASLPPSGQLTRGDGEVPGVLDNVREDKLVRYSMPEKVELELIDGEKKNVQLCRTEFLRYDEELNARLRSDWIRLRDHGQLKDVRQNLPAYRTRDELRNALKMHSVVVIGGETGSGKTTQVPQYLYEFMCEDGVGSAANIVCTQPRRLAAMAVALRVAEEREEAVGGTVGYSIRLENCVSARTQILYCTTGIVLRRMQTDKFLGRVSHIVVDEIHERGVDTDFLLILLRDLLSRRNDLKVILMSATMESDLFSRYFGGAPIVSIAGRTFPVTVYHLEDILPLLRFSVEEGSPYALRDSGGAAPSRRNARKGQLGIDVEEALGESHVHGKTASALKSSLGGASQTTLETISRMNLEVINFDLIHEVVRHIVLSVDVKGAILVFLPGMAEIHRCSENLLQDVEISHRCVVFNLHSSLGSSNQKDVFRRPQGNLRKVVIGTNIMETSITIDDAVFVIDCGKSKENHYNAQKSMSQLVLTNISKANCRQRQGRAGRVSPGFCFRLYTSEQYERFADHQLCEMHRVPLESLVLQIYTLKLGDEVEYLSKALSPPEERAIQSSVKVLTQLGALTQEKRLTSLGWHLANLPIDVRIGKMIIHSALLRCVDPVLTIAACLAVRSPFVSLIDLQAEVMGVRRAFGGESMSDHIGSWMAYQAWAAALHRESPSAARKMCQNCYLSYPTLTQIQATKQQYERYLYESGFIDGVRKEGRASRFVFEPFVSLDGRVYEAGGAAFNTEAGSIRCITACLVAGLYPNIARISRRYSSHAGVSKVRIDTFDGSEALCHPSSVVGKVSNVTHSFLVYVDKVKTSATFLREVSMVSPLQVILFGGGTLDYLADYQELCIGDVCAVKCGKEEALLLTHLKEQLHSALRAKINNPQLTWESASSVVVRAIVAMLRDEANSGKYLTVVDRRASRQPLTTPLLGQPPAQTVAASPQPDQPFSTKKSCFICGEAGHTSRYCPQGKERRSGGPSQRCFICGLWHHPVDCPVAIRDY